MEENIHPIFVNILEALMPPTEEESVKIEDNES